MKLTEHLQMKNKIYDVTLREPLKPTRSKEEPYEVGGVKRATRGI